MRGLRNPVLLAIPLLIAGCFLLPNAVSGLTDAKRFDNLVVIEAQRVNFESETKLTLTDRLALTASSATESLILKNGRFLNTESAAQNAAGELSEFLGNSSFVFNLTDYTVNECSASFIIDSSDPSVNMIVWNVTLTDDQSRWVYLAIDDETGIILQMQFRKPATGLYSNSADIDARSPKILNADDGLRLSAELIAELLTGYYGLPVTLEDYEPGAELAYYRADVESDKTVLPLYGVVRESGFTINERVP